MRSVCNKIVALVVAFAACMGIVPTANAEMYGPDVSGWNAQARTDCASIPGDFLIVKATEGVGFKFAQFDQCVTQALAAGKRVAAYHYARPAQSSSLAEANHFLDAVRPYRGRIWTFLDYEDTPAPDWARDWLKIVSQTMGQSTGIYMSASWVNRQDWGECTRYPLWIAGYPAGYARFSGYNPPSFPYRVKGWQVVSMWQFTSSGYLNNVGAYDLNVFYGSGQTWDKLAASAPPSTRVATPSGTIDSQPAAQSKDVDTLARETIRGVYGVGAARRAALGANYAAVQARVNQILGSRAAAPVSRVHVVRRGECLSGIFGRDWQRVARLSGIRAPYTIYPGQRLRY